MKKLWKIIILFLLLNISKVKAITPDIEYMENVYSNRIGTEKSINGKMGYVTMLGQVSFCLDPFKIIGTEYEIDNDILNNYLTEEQIERVRLIIHYGSNTHLKDQYYYMATQELIWETLSEGEFYFTTTPSLDGERINIDEYKDEILEKVEKHNLVPTIGNLSLTPKLYDNITLLDENELLDEYMLINKSKNIVSKTNNMLYIQVLDKNETTIKLKKYSSSGVYSNTYVGNGQTLITANVNATRNYLIDINPVGVNYYLDIRFFESNNLVRSNIKFKIFNTSTSQYINDGEVFESNSSGIFYSDFRLDVGTYEIVYVDIPSPYIPPDIVNTFTLTEDSPVNNQYRYEVISYLNVPKGKLIINRKVELLDGSFLPLSNMKYKIYANSYIYNTHSQLLYRGDDLVDSVTTINGTADILLPMSGYYVIEEPNPYGIDSVPKQYVAFNYIDNVTDIYPFYLDLVTYLPKLNLNIKTWKEEIDTTYSDFSNYEYSIYAAEDIYYLDELIYSAGDFIIDLTSDTYGIYNSNLSLPYGKYEIREKTKDDNYYDLDSVFINFRSDYQMEKLDFYKNLKRGNLLINLITDNPDEYKLIFDYNGISEYDIENTLLLENIKIGSYKVIYDKEYDVEIFDNQTTILNIIIKDKKEENEESTNPDNPNNDGEIDNPDTPEVPEEVEEPTNPDNQNADEEIDNPDTPELPEEVEEPTNSENPNEDEEIDNPDTPEIPEEVEEPTNPDNPNADEEPNNPDTAEFPEEVEEPTNSENPNEDEEIDNPDTPEISEEVEEPTNPDNPNDYEEIDNPDTPEIPEEVEEPTNPENPNEDEEIDNPDTPEIPEEVEEPINSDISDGNEEIDNSEIPEVSNKEELNNENNSIADNSNIELLPNTYNYLEQYCFIFKIFILGSLLYRLYDQKD